MLRVYSYTYGSGSSPNREIEFQQDKDGRIIAIARARFNGQWIETSRLQENSMRVEALSTKEKIQIMKEARAKGIMPDYPDDLLLSAIKPEEKRQLILSLEPEGPWRISVENGIGTSPRFEQIKHLDFFKLDT
jgi:hypothetical protein